MAVMGTWWCRYNVVTGGKVMICSTNRGAIRLLFQHAKRGGISVSANVVKHGVRNSAHRFQMLNILSCC